MLKVLFPAICFYYVATGHTPQIGRHVIIVKQDRKLPQGLKKTTVLQHREIKTRNVMVHTTNWYISEKKNMIKTSDFWELYLCRLQLHMQREKHFWYFGSKTKWFSFSTETIHGMIRLEKLRAFSQWRHLSQELAPPPLSSSDISEPV